MVLNRYIIFSIAGIAALALVSYFYGSKTDRAPVDPAFLPGIQTGFYPWDPGTGRLKERLEMIGLPALSQEGTRLHSHQHLDFYINGARHTLPSEIGVGEGDGFISPLHTHEGDSIIHVESPTIKTFTLGQFFDVWGVLFTDDCLGGYCNGGEERLRIYVNGAEIPDGFRNIALKPYQQITVTFGRKSDEPEPIPARHDFPPNY